MNLLQEALIAREYTANKLTISAATASPWIRAEHAEAELDRLNSALHSIRTHLMSHGHAEGVISDTLKIVDETIEATKRNAWLEAKNHREALVAAHGELGQD